MKNTRKHSFKGRKERIQKKANRILEGTGYQKQKENFDIVSTDEYSFLLL